jgi:hypothetical protein
MVRIAILAMAASLIATGCSDNGPADLERSIVKEAVAESDETSGQSTLKIAVNPRTGEILPGGFASVEVQAPQQAPEYWVTDSPVRGQLLHSSTGFMTPLTAVIGCDGSVSVGHGVLPTGDADCGSSEGP